MRAKTEMEEKKTEKREKRGKSIRHGSRVGRTNERRKKHAVKGASRLHARNARSDLAWSERPRLCFRLTSACSDPTVPPMRRKKGRYDVWGDETRRTKEREGDKRKKRKL